MKSRSWRWARRRPNTPCARPSPPAPARAVRIDAPHGLASDAVATAIAAVATGATWVVCGDASADRGTGAVPAYLAAELGAAQALGLVAVDPLARDGAVRVTRRLDGGRREILDVRTPAVLSVEGAVARLRRASLPAELAARNAPIERLIGPRHPVEVDDLAHPYRPRPRALAAPTRRRAGTGAKADRRERRCRGVPRERRHAGSAGGSRADPRHPRAVGVPGR